MPTAPATALRGRPLRKRPSEEVEPGFEETKEMGGFGSHGNYMGRVGYRGSYSIYSICSWL